MAFPPTRINSTKVSKQDKDDAARDGPCAYTYTRMARRAQQGSSDLRCAHVVVPFFLRAEEKGTITWAQSTLRNLATKTEVLRQGAKGSSIKDVRIKGEGLPNADATVNFYL